MLEDYAEAAPERAADEVNLNEKFESKAEFDGNGVAVRLAPWEIKTYKIKL